MDQRVENFVPHINLGGNVPLGSGAAIEHHDIDGIKLSAFYDAAHRLLFVLDTTKDEILPNTVLILDSKGGRKWDDILANDFGVDPETVRPRANNKYQKLDIDYESLKYYNDVIVSKQRDVLAATRDEIAMRHRDIRLGEAYHEIDLAESTVREATKTIHELDEFMALQKDKLHAAKKEVGKVPPKDSAAKILRFEARIERAAAKKARSERRLLRAQKRIASAKKMLNNYRDILTPRGVEMNDNEVKPLFTENPNIIDNENAFKPVSFNHTPPPAASAHEPRSEGWSPAFSEAAPAAPAFGDSHSPSYPAPHHTPNPVHDFTPPQHTAQTPTPPQQHMTEHQRPASHSNPHHVPRAHHAAPPPPPLGADIKIEPTYNGRAGGAYYLLLMILIGLSIYTLYLYQQRMSMSETPHIAAAVVTEDVYPETSLETESDQVVFVDGPAPIVGMDPFMDELPGIYYDEPADFGNCEAMLRRCAAGRCPPGACTDMTLTMEIVQGCMISQTTGCQDHGDALVQSVTAQIVAQQTANHDDFGHIEPHPMPTFDPITPDSPYYPHEHEEEWNNYHEAVQLGPEPLPEGWYLEDETYHQYGYGGGHHHQEVFEEFHPEFHHEPELLEHQHHYDHEAPYGDFAPWEHWEE